MRSPFLHFLKFTILFLLFDGNIINAQTTNTTVISNGDIGRFSRNQPVDIDVLGNDFGLEYGVKSLTITALPQYGNAKVTSKNTIIYTPNLNYLGEDRFKYKVCGINGDCDIAEVLVYVTEYDYQPVAVNDTIVYENNPKKKQECDILKNDINAWDFPVTINILTELKKGTVQVNSNNTITPTFEDNFIGNDSLLYSVVDREGDSDTAMVLFNVTPKVIEIGAAVPNGFSPNGDGFNDVFYIPELDANSDLEISVFNQTGGLVYEDKAYQNNWNGIANTGKYSGKDLPSGTYYYLVQVKNSSTKISGYIFLSR